MANVCFGCNEVEDIKKCPKKDCFHYFARDSHLDMDYETNRDRNIMVKRTWKTIIEGR